MVLFVVDVAVQTSWTDGFRTPNRKLKWRLGEREMAAPLQFGMGRFQYGGLQLTLEAVYFQ